MSLKESSPLAAVCSAVRISADFARFRVARVSQTFGLNGQQYRYFGHPYNFTWFNERQAEVAIVKPHLQACTSGRVLEVGNVLSHYFPVSHDVVDKYEPAARVINVDVVDYTPDQSYDLIVSISTLEHIGWDEQPKDPPKVIRAVEHLRGLLAPGGQMVVTLPIAYNPALDAYLDEGMVGFDEQYSLRRNAHESTWFETDWAGVKTAKYDFGLKRADGLLIGINYARERIEQTS